MSGSQTADFIDKKGSLNVSSLYMAKKIHIILKNCPTITTKPN